MVVCHDETHGFHWRVLFTCVDCLLAAVRVAYVGRCRRPEVAECNYASNSKPVCADDGLIYLNAAQVACKNKLQPARRELVISTTVLFDSPHGKCDG